jgi:type I restriction enzyme, R subunit
VNNLKGDDARGQFINLFKEVQRLKTQLDQYTDLTEADQANMAAVMPEEQLKAFRGVYLETAKRLKAQQNTGEADNAAVQQLDFEFVLFNSVVIDYDYIMAVLARFSQGPAEKHKMNRQELIGLIAADSKFIDEREDITAYINTLKAGAGLSEQTIRQGYVAFRAEQKARELRKIANAHGLEPVALQAFVDLIMQRMIFDGEALSDLLAPLGLGWKVRAQKETELMRELIPVLNKLAQGREISGLSAYEQ